MSRFQILGALAVLALAAFFAFVYVDGCSKAKPRETSIESQTEGEVRIDGGDISLSNSAGTVSLGGKVPDDFPKSVPIYPGARINLSRRAAGDKPAWSLALVTGDDPDHVVAFYRSNLAGFEVTSDRTLADTHMSTWQSAQLAITLVVAMGADQETSISMTVSGR